MGWRNALAIGLLVLAAAGPGRAATLEVGPDKPFKQPSAAIATAKPGDTMSIAPGQYYDCAVIHKDNLDIEGAAPGAVLAETSPVRARLSWLSAATTSRSATWLCSAPGYPTITVPASGRRAAISLSRTCSSSTTRRASSPPTIPTPPSGLSAARSSIMVHAREAVRTASIPARGLGCRVEHTRFFETQHTHNIKSRALTTEVIDCDIEDKPPEACRAIRSTCQNGGSLVYRGRHALEKGRHAKNYKSDIIIGEEGVRSADRQDPFA